MNNTLDCPIVRDLLPLYIDDLCEVETAELIKEHLKTCSKCTTLEKQMRSDLQLQKATFKGFQFLRHLKKIRLIIVVVTCILTPYIMYRLYDNHYHYPNTESGRLAAVEDFVTQDSSTSFESRYDIEKGTPLKVIDYILLEDDLLCITYQADNEQNIFGYMTLKKGLNGKYAPLRCSQSAFPYKAGVKIEHYITPDSNDTSGKRIIMGIQCDEIESINIHYHVNLGSESSTGEYTKNYPLIKNNFIWIFNDDEILKSLNLEPKGKYLFVRGIDFLDENGNVLNEKYYIDGLETNGGYGKGGDENKSFYADIVFVFIVGTTIIFVCFKKDDMIEFCGFR